MEGRCFIEPGPLMDRINNAYKDRNKLLSAGANKVISRILQDVSKIGNKIRTYNESNHTESDKKTLIDTFGNDQNKSIMCRIGIIMGTNPNITSEYGTHKKIIPVVHNEPENILNPLTIMDRLFNSLPPIHESILDDESFILAFYAFLFGFFNLFSILVYELFAWGPLFINHINRITRPGYAYDAAVASERRCAKYTCYRAMEVNTLPNMNSRIIMFGTISENDDDPNMTEYDHAIKRLQEDEGLNSKYKINYYNKYIKYKSKYMKLKRKNLI